MAIYVTIQVEIHKDDEEAYRSAKPDTHTKRNMIEASVNHGHYVIANTIDEGPNI